MSPDQIKELASSILAETVSAPAATQSGERGEPPVGDDGKLTRQPEVTQAIADRTAWLKELEDRYKGGPVNPLVATLPAAKVDDPIENGKRSIEAQQEVLKWERDTGTKLTYESAVALERTIYRLMKPAAKMDARVPTPGHGYTGPFTATEFNERAFDHEKAAKNGMAAGPNVSYVRTFLACAAALRYAAKHMFASQPPESVTVEVDKLLAQRVDILARFYRMHSVEVANLCDLELDKSGGLLGKVRDAARLIQSRTAP